ncbi:glycosyltransferase WbuB [bacterium]|nr:glycosyltransferase WbuB [bacterium]
MSKPPKLLIFCQLFYPELVSTGLTVTELAEALTDRGVAVSVVCGPPTIMDQTSYLPRVIDYRGIHIERVKGTRYPKLSFWGKLVNHLTFAFGVARYLISRPINSPILVITNPPFLGFVCALVSLVKRIKFIYLVFDVYPETAVQAGVLSETGTLTRLWNWANQLVYRRAAKIVVIGRCMAERVGSGLSEKDRQKITKIHVWSDDANIVTGKSGAEKKFREKWGLGDRLVIGYSGNLGRFHELNSLIAAACILKDRDDIQFVIVGEGHQKADLESEARRNGLKNVQFHTYVEREDLGQLLASFDVGVVTLKSGQEGLSVPSKTFGLMAAGLPILGIVPEASEIARIIHEHACGWVIKPGDVNEIVEKICFAAGHRDRLAELGQNSQSAVAAHYTLGAAADAYVKLITSDL